MSTFVAGSCAVDLFPSIALTITCRFLVKTNETGISTNAYRVCAADYSFIYTTFFLEGSAMPGCLAMFVFMVFFIFVGGVTAVVFGCKPMDGATITLIILCVVGFLLDPKRFLDEFKLPTKEEIISERREKHRKTMKSARKNSKVCPRCNSKGIATSWKDTSGIGKVGRQDVYICQDCGHSWSLNRKGNVPWWKS